MLTELVSELDRLADRFRNESGIASNLRFGSRTLRLTRRESVADPAAWGGLLPADPDAEPDAELALLTRDEAAGLEVGAETILGPYGAVLDSADGEWLVVLDPGIGRVLALHRPSRFALHYPGHRVPPRDRAEFCRPLLHWLAILDGNVIVHAGAVATARGAVLVAGAGNAGKSTLIRTCLTAGWRYLGDNVVEVELTPEGPRVHPAYPTFKVRRDPAVPVPASWPAPSWDPDAEKDIYFLASEAEASIAGPDTELRATLILDPSGSESPAPLAAGPAFFRVAPNTVAQFPFFEQEALSRTATVLSAVPVFLAGRMPIEDAPDRVARLLTGVGAPS